MYISILGDTIKKEQPPDDNLLIALADNRHIEIPGLVVLRENLCIGAPRGSNSMKYWKDRSQSEWLLCCDFRDQQADKKHVRSNDAHDCNLGELVYVLLTYSFEQKPADKQDNTW